MLFYGWGIKQAEHLESTSMERRWEQIWNLREESLHEQGISLGVKECCRVHRYGSASPSAYRSQGAINSEDFAGHSVAADL